MAEKKEGFLKRIFRFGKKKREEEEPATAAADTAAAEAKAAEEAAAAAETQRLEEERLEQERLNAERLEAERLEQERLEAERQEAARKAAEEAAELKARQEAAEQAARERAEKAAREKAEKEQADREQAERERAEKEAAEKAAATKAAAEKAEQERLEAERLAEEEAEKHRIAEQQAANEAERERLAKEAAEAEAKAEAERLEREAAAEKARLEAEAAEAERLVQEKAAQEAAEAERLAAEERAAEAAELARIAEEKRKEEERERAEAEAKEKAEEEARLREQQEAEELAAAEQAAREQAEAARVAAEIAETELAAAEAESARQDEEASAPLAPEPEPEVQPKKKSWFSRLKDGLAKSSSNLTENITAVFTKKKLDEDTLQELEDILIQADLGVETSMNITEKLASQRMGKDVTDEEVRDLMASEIETVLNPVAAELELDLDHQPHVILVVGVNGSGKTTTIGKLSQKLYDAGFSTLLVAGDTFRAAAIEQLQIWGDRTLSPVVSRPLGSDSAGLAFDAYEQAKDEGRDVMLMDTAGRLQNKKELMDELEKIIRVLKKQDPTAPHTVLLTLDATTGQNAMNQVDIFRDVAGVNGLVMTKLDGTARGGILVAISAKHKLPVYFLGVGETVDDLEPFEARDFARSIAGLEV